MTKKSNYNSVTLTDLYTLWLAGTDAVAAQTGGVNTAPVFASSFKGVVTTDFGNYDYGLSMTVQADGKILVAGKSGSDFALARYTANGDLDTSFSGDGKLTTSIGSSDDVGNSVTVQADGKILVAGYSYKGGTDDFALVRYNANGSLDNSFSGDGKLTTDWGFDDYGYSVALQSDGKILVSGESNYSFALARYTTNGELDTSFSGDGKLTTDFGSWNTGYSVAVQADGKILVAGQNGNHHGYDSNFALARYTANGELDTSFSGDGMLITDWGGDDYGYSMTIQADGKILVAGKSGGYHSDFALARYTANGELDRSFSGDGIVTTDFGGNHDIGESVTVQADGKILLAGTSIKGSYSVSDFALARYTANGELDTSFSGDGIVTTDLGDRSGNYAYSVTVQANGLIAVAGSSDDNFALVRYNPDGSVATNLPSYIENGAAVKVDYALTLTDAELGDNYAGSHVTVARQGGASSGDVLALDTTRASFGVSQNQLIANGKVFGTYSTGKGILALNFTSTGIPATAALVNDVLQHVTYRNSTDRLPMQVVLEWVANDGNTGGQGSGGALIGRHTSTVQMVSVNDPLTGTVTISGIATQGQTLTASHSLADADGVGTITYTWKTGITVLGTGNTYLLKASDVAHTVAVTASYTDLGGTHESKASAASGMVGIVKTGTASADTLSGTAGNDILNGSGGNDTLNGGNGDDRIDGGSGNDTLVGGAGNDVYIADASGDVVTEASGGGTDSIYSSASRTLAANVENLILIGTTAINGTGNELANILVGNTANNVLSGGTDNDTLNGGLGNDTLTGGAGKDVFRFNTAALAANADKITDFSVADDTVQLENAIFTKLAATGVLNTAYLKIGTAAADANDFIVYNKTTGGLFYDADGNGAGTAVQIATLGVGLALTNADFVVI